MDFDKMPLMVGVKKRMAWLIRRQEVLAQNIANADTPGYKARDLRPFNFADIVKRQSMQINMDRTHPDHQEGPRHRVSDFAEHKERRPYETAPAGNAVILEEQMGKINESQIQYKMMSELYKKHLAMFRLAIAKR